MDEFMYDEDDMDEGHGEMHDEDMDEDMDEDLDEEIDLEEILNELELEEDEAIVDENEEQLDEMGRPIYKAEEANNAHYQADYVHESEEFDLDALLQEINSLDEKDKRPEGSKPTPTNPKAIL